MFKISQMLDDNNLYSVADKVDRIAQAVKNFNSDQEALAYINSLIGRGGIMNFAQAMDSAANQGVSVKNISIKNIPQMQAKYKESIPKTPMMPMPMGMPVQPMPMQPMGMPMTTMPIVPKPVLAPMAPPAPQPVVQKK